MFGRCNICNLFRFGFIGGAFGNGNRNRCRCRHCCCCCRRRFNNGEFEPFRGENCNRCF